MENIGLHQQKVAILSRLVKESSLTLEEALLLLEQEVVQESVQNHVQPVQQPYWSGTPWVYSGSGIISTGSGTVSTYTTNNGTTFNISTSDSQDADLNN